MAIEARRTIDLSFLITVLALVTIGVGMVYSASFVVGHNDFGDGTYFLTRHLVWLAIGLVVLLVTARLDYHLWQRVATPLYVVSVALLALVLIPGLGNSTYGASRWISLGPLPSVQPSEIAKLAIVIYLASWVARVGPDINRLTFGTIPFAIIVSISAGLVLVEPDLGTTIVLVATAGSLFFVGGASLSHLLLGGLSIAFLLANFVVSSGYRADRMEAFRNPWADPAGIGWHTTQALIALGSGGLAGLGLGAGRGKFYYLPNAHTDSIFAIVGEEIGFVGTTLVVLLFLFLAWRGLAIALAARDPFGRALAAGATLLIAWQAVLNMAVVSHLVPNTGVPLPFLSYGGSSMVTTLTAVGLVLSVSRTIDPQRRSWRAIFTGNAPAEETHPAAAGRGARRAPARTSSVPVARTRGGRASAVAGSRGGRAAFGAGR